MIKPYCGFIWKTYYLKKSIASDKNELGSGFSQFTVLGLIVMIISTFSLLDDDVSYDDFYFYACAGILLIIFGLLRGKIMNSIFVTHEKMVIYHRNQLIWRISFSTIKSFNSHTSLDLELHCSKLLNIEYNKIPLEESEIKKIEKILGSHILNE